MKRRQASWVSTRVTRWTMAGPRALQSDRLLTQDWRSRSRLMTIRRSWQRAR